MLVYYDTETGRIRHTINGDPATPPAGDFITVPDETEIKELSALKVEDGQLVIADLTPLKLRAVAAVNKAVCTERCKYITDISGQDMIYREKEAEAKAWLASDPEASSLDDYPFIAGEIGTTAPTATEVAQVFLSMSAQWRQVGAQLEQIRITANTMINSAISEAEIDQALADCRSSLQNV